MAEHRRPRFSIKVPMEKMKMPLSRLGKWFWVRFVFLEPKSNKEKTYILEIHLVRSFKWPAWIKYPSNIHPIQVDLQDDWTCRNKGKVRMQIMYILKSTNFCLCVDVFWHGKFVTQYRIRYLHQSQHADVDYYKWCCV